MSLIQMSISGAVIILVTVFIRAMLFHRFPKRTFLVMWGIILVRLLVSYSLPCSLSMYSLLAHSGAAEETTENVAVPIIPSFSVDATFGNTLTIDPWMVVWLIGMLLCFVFFTVSYLKYVRRFRESLPVDNDFIKKWIAKHRLFRRLSVRCSDQISIPLTYGVIHPVILLPKKFEQIDMEDLKFVLTHEYIHIRRFDAAFKLVLAVALCVHWFNPIVWIMYIIANKDIELSCDEGVVHMLGDNEKEAYAMSMIRMEESKSGLAPLFNHFVKNAVKERITAIMKLRKASALTIIVASCLIVGTTTVFATTVETQNNHSVQQTSQLNGLAVENKTIEDSTNNKTITDTSLAVETTDDTQALNNTIPAETEENFNEEEISSAEITVTLEPGTEITMPNEGGAYIITVDADENGNRIVRYFPIEDEPAPVTESDGYTHEEIVEDGILRW